MSFRNSISITSILYAVLLFRPILLYSCDNKLGDEMELLFFLALEQNFELKIF